MADGITINGKPIPAAQAAGDDGEQITRFLRSLRAAWPASYKASDMLPLARRSLADLQRIHDKMIATGQTRGWDWRKAELDKQITFMQLHPANIIKRGSAEDYEIIKAISGPYIEAYGLKDYDKISFINEFFGVARDYLHLAANALPDLPNPKSKSVFGKALFWGLVGLAGWKLYKSMDNDERD